MNRSSRNTPPKKFPHKCRTPFCRKLVLKSNKSPICSRCRSRQWAEKHPLKYSFKNLRVRAKQRGHSFGLSFAEYERFAAESGYALLKGKTKASLTIDRRDPKRGYELDNIRAVRLVTNSRIAYTKMPQWLKDEMVAAEAAGIREEVDSLTASV